MGRADDVIKSAGYRIGPFEVESALIEHPAVVEAAVIGKPDATRGQIVKAFVVLAAGNVVASERAGGRAPGPLQRLTAPYKYPREIEFVDGAAQDHQRQDPPGRPAGAANELSAPIAPPTSVSFFDSRPCRPPAVTI